MTAASEATKAGQGPPSAANSTRSPASTLERNLWASSGWPHRPQAVMAFCFARSMSAHRPGCGAGDDSAPSAVGGYKAGQDFTRLVNLVALIVEVCACDADK